MLSSSLWLLRLRNTVIMTTAATPRAPAPPASAVTLVSVLPLTSLAALARASSAAWLLLYDPESESELEVAATGAAVVTAGAAEVSTGAADTEALVSDDAESSSPASGSSLEDVETEPLRLPLLLLAVADALSEDADAVEEETELTVTLTPASLELSPAETALDEEESCAAETPLAGSAKARSSAMRRKPTFMLEVR